MMTIKEIIVVEGRDDTNAIKRAVDAETIETHGFGISKETWTKLDRAYENPGLIIFTDPDHSGEEIRRRLKEKYPEAKEAFLSRGKALGNKDIGIENAKPEDIAEALSKAKATTRSDSEIPEFNISDLEEACLVGMETSSLRREKLGDILGIGYSNGKSLLRKLNTMGIKKEDFLRAVEKLNEEFKED